MSLLTNSGRDTARAPRKRQLLFDIETDDTRSNSSLPGDVTPVQQHRPQPSSQPTAVAFATTPSGTPTSRPTIEANLTGIENAGEASGRANEQDCDGLGSKGSHKEQVGMDVSVSRRLHFGSQISHIVADSDENNNNAEVGDGGGLHGDVSSTPASDIPNAEPQSELPADVDISINQARLPVSDEGVRPRQVTTRTHTAERAVNRFPASSNADGDELFRWGRVHRGRVLPTMHQPELAANGGSAVAGKRQAGDRDWSSPDRLRRRPSAYYTSHQDTAGVSAGANTSKMADPVHENGSGVGSSALTRSRLGAMTRGEQLVAMAGGTLPVLAHKEAKAEKMVQDDAEATKKAFRGGREEAEVDNKGSQKAVEVTAQQSAGVSTKLPAE